MLLVLLTFVVLGWHVSLMLFNFRPIEDVFFVYHLLARWESRLLATGNGIARLTRVLLNFMFLSLCRHHQSFTIWEQTNHLRVLLKLFRLFHIRLILHFDLLLLILLDLNDVHAVLRPSRISVWGNFFRVLGYGASMAWVLLTLRAFLSLLPMVASETRLVLCPILLATSWFAEKSFCWKLLRLLLLLWRLLLLLFLCDLRVAIP